MKKQKRYPEVYVEQDFLTRRPDIVQEVIQVDEDSFRVTLDHPVLGETVERFEIDHGDGTLCLRSIYPKEMQTIDEIEIAKDYYNNFLLEGEQTYVEYFNKDVGYFLLSRNIGVYDVN
jgi:hypothetical protein